MHLGIFLECQVLIYLVGMCRTIIALWKNRTLSVEQQMDLIASVEAGDGMKYAVADRQRQVDENQAFLGVEDAHMSELASMDSSLTVSRVTESFQNIMPENL